MTGRKPKWWRRFWIQMAIMLVGLSVLDIALYLFNVIDLDGLSQGILSIFSGIFFAYTVRHIMTEVLSEKTVLRTMKIAYPLGGVCIGIIAGMALTVLIVSAFKIPKPATTFELYLRSWLVFGVAPAVGALVFYWWGKRRGFRPYYQLKSE